MPWCRSRLILPLVVAFVVACDRRGPVEPALDLRAANAPGSTLNAPSNLTALAVSISRIDLSWQDNSSNEGGFQVHRSTTGASGAFTLRASLAVNTSAYSDTGLTASTQYC